MRDSLVIFLLIQRISAIPGSFWHISDHHYDPTVETVGRSCSQQIDQLGKYGHSLCDSTWALINSSVYAMRSIQSEAEFIVWTGDDTLHYLNGTVGTQQEVIDIIANISYLIQAQFPNIPVVASLGNHDYVPDNQLPAAKNPIYTALSQVWGNWIVDSEEIKRFETFGYYSKRLNPKLTAVALNTNYYYTGNKLHADTSDPGNQFAWLEEILHLATLNNGKVLITAHVPYGVGALGDYVHMYPQHNKRFVALVSKYSDVIMGQLFGHEHIDSFKILLDKDRQPLGSVFCAPSVTPWRAIIPGVINQPPRNPAIRLVTYDQMKLKLLDYEQWYLLLDRANEGEDEWKRLYSFTQAYGIPDMSTASVFQVAQSIRNGSKTSTYWKNYHIGGNNLTCDSHCRYGLSCAIMEVTQPGAKLCVENEDNPTSRSTTLSNSVLHYTIALILTFYYFLYTH